MKPTPIGYMQRTRENYEKLGFEPYQWFQADTAPAFAPVEKPLAESRLGLVSTAGAYVRGQVAYHYRDDTGIRSIPADTRVADLRFSHIMENLLVEARQDPCVVFPLEALRRLADEGVIGEPAANYYSCMGGVYSTRRVREELIPDLEAALAKERLDLLLLVPL